MANLNLNTFPYYDDYNPQKGFHRLLFKPGYAVQARELTQLQTILQEQIKRFGDHIFKDGSVVLGCAESTNFAVPYVTISDTDGDGRDIDNDTLSSFEGLVVTNETTGVKAVIKKTLTGSSTESPNLKTLYLHYTATGTDNVTTLFESGDTLTTEDGDTFVVSGVGEGALLSVDEGIVYADGSFVLHTNQTTVVGRYTTTPTAKVGFIINEQVISSVDDESLLDPAQGSYNYTAPGADRFKLSTELITVPDGDEIPEGFYILFDIDSGKIKRKYNSAQYSELNKTLARRTYDESGDYTVRAFPLVVREHLKTSTNNGRYTSGEGGDAGKLVVAVEPGKAYVKGYEHELFATDFLDVNKAIATDTKGNQAITTYYGSYVVVDTVTGTWPIDLSATVNLINGSASTIGTARVRELEYIDGTNYKLYLYDIQMSSGSFVDVVTIDYSAGNASASVADTPAILQNTSYSTPIFEATYKNLKAITDASFVYRKVITGVTVTSGVISHSVTGDPLSFTTATNNDIIIVNQASPYDYKSFTSGSYASSTLTITGVGGTFSGTVTLLVAARKTASQNSKTIRSGRYVKIETTTNTGALTGPYILGFHDVIEIENVWAADSSVSSYPSNPETDSNWTDVTNLFTLNNNQKDSYYDLSTMSLSTAFSSHKKLLVKLKYFEHSAGSYYTVESYPLPAENVAPTSSQIEWYDIPTYTSTGGKVFNLRDCIDFRHTIASTATDTTSIGSATLDPAAGSTFVSGFINPAPTEEFICDVEFHLPRIDRVVLDSEGTFAVVEGVPSLTPVRPRQPDNAMTLGYVTIAPYPSLSPYLAKQVDKQDYACRISIVDNRRFTMRDIGEIHRRIDRLEYYTSLSLLEQNTANLLIANEAGEDRFKNGILVDSFIGHNIGNVFDPTYNCSIADGELRPFFNLENIEFEYSSDSTAASIARKADDAIIVVRIPKSNSYTVGNSVSNGAGASGTIKHSATIVTDDTYKYVRLYLNGVTGTFSSGNTITQGAVVGTITYGTLTTGLLPTALRPDLVVTPEDGNLVTLPYDHVVYAENPYASKVRNAVSQLLFTYNGTMRLSPPVDIWTDTNRLPEVQINLGGTADNWERLEQAWGTQWGNWETVWQGTTVDSEQTAGGATEVTETTTQRRQREGTGIDVTTTTVVNDLGNRVVSATLLPFMRSIVVNFRASRMKANTKVFAFFDGVNVSEFCRLVGNYDYGDDLVVDADGEIHGQFRIPANTFNVGTKTFIICDNETNPEASDIKTIAIASFAASGLAVAEQNTIVSTRVPEITVNRQTQTQESVVSRTTRIEPVVDQPINPDPIAQTFYVSGQNNGIMLTKIDTYFKTKSTTAPITLQIREIINGYPSDSIVPFSTVTLHPKDVNTSTDASAVTEFKFESPVYLKNETEYCFVLLPAGNDENYDVWVSELGQNQIGTTQRIDKQPYSGVLFVSANNRTWTAIQSEDVKFTLYRAEFETATPGELVVQNIPMDFLKLSNESVEFSPGDLIVSDSGATGTVKYYDDRNNVVKVLVDSGTFVDAEDVSGVIKLTGTVTCVTSSTTLTGTGTLFNSEITNGDILVSPTNVVIGTVASVSNDTELTLTTGAAVNLTASIAYNQEKTATISEIQDKLVTAISPTLGYLDFNNTDVIWEHKIYNTDESDGAYTILNAGGTTEFLVAKTVFSQSNIAETFKLQATLTTENDNISPVIDLEKLGCVVVENYVNNDDTDEDTNDGDAYSKYISRRVILDDGQESEDLRVYLTAQIPSGSSVKVYAKLLNDTDPQNFDDRPWLELDQTLPLATSGFREYYYTLPVGGTSTEKGGKDSGTGVYNYTTSTILYEGFKAFAVKIVMLSDSATSVPIIRDMRAIALMV